MNRLHPGQRLAVGSLRVYQLTLSSLIGRQCRHLPSCSAYMAEAITRHGVWAGGWMGVARVCRCNPWGTDGLDFVPAELPARSSWYRPWRYGRWRGTETTPPAPQDGRGPGDGGPSHS